MADRSNHADRINFGKLREVIQPVLALPVVGDKVKPIADEMLTALAAFAPAQP